MDITLNQDEIEKAVREFIGNQGISISNKLVSISLTAGRGANGHSASVTILPSKNPTTSKKPKADPERGTAEDVMKENTEEFKEQDSSEPEFEITEEAPAETILETAGEAEEEETDSLFGA